MSTAIIRLLVHFWPEGECLNLTSLVAQMLKHLPTMWETRVQSLGREDLLEKEMATHSSILAWKILWTEEPGRLQSMGSQRVGHCGDTSLSFTFPVIDSYMLKENLYVISNNFLASLPEQIQHLTSATILA